MENTSGVKPLGRAVLVRYYEPERQDSAIIIPTHVKRHAGMVEQRAQVVEVGPSCWPDEPPRAASGDYVLLSYASGYQLFGPADGKLYRLVNDRDIFAALTHTGPAASPVEDASEV